MAFKSKRKTNNNNNLEQQYLASRSLTFKESICSIVATEVSALTFLGIPAFAYQNNFSFIHIYIGAIFGRIVIAKFILPYFYNNGLTIYEAMAKNGTRNGQRFIALFYSFNKFLAVGVRLFSGSILISSFFDISIYLAVFIISLITFIYTFIGGLKAVVRTDMLQLFILVSGGVIAHFVIPSIGDSSWSHYMSLAYENGKISLLTSGHSFSFITGIICGFLFDICTHGVDQDFAQRLIATKNLKTGQRSIFYSSFLSIGVGLLFLGVGALLWSFYQTHPLTVNIKPDKLFAYFITEHFPVGLKGLMVAGVMAATMSTLDSSINALSACFHNDIFQRTNKGHIQNHYRNDVIFITMLFLVIAYIASTSDQILILGLKIASWTGGSLLALFFATSFFRKFTKATLDAQTVIMSYFFGILGVYINSFILKYSWHFNVYFGFFFCFAMSTLLGRIRRTI